VFGGEKGVTGQGKTAHYWRDFMTLRSNTVLVIGVAILLIAGIAIGMSLNSPTAAQGPAGTGAARYSVVETDGISLIVTDNQKNTVFFYTVNQDDKPGSDLQLRGTIDLNSVGQTTIKPTLRTTGK
jgi:hypothetical protein